MTAQVHQGNPRCCKSKGLMWWAIATLCHRSFLQNTRVSDIPGVAYKQTAGKLCRLAMVHACHRRRDRRTDGRAEFQFDYKLTSISDSRFEVIKDCANRKREIANAIWRQVSPANCMSRPKAFQPVPCPKPEKIWEIMDGMPASISGCGTPYF